MAPRTDPDVLRWGSSGGCGSPILGSPFLLGGLVGIAALSGAVPLRVRAAPLVIAIPGCAVFVVVGLAVMFGRTGAIVDRRAGTVTTWWGSLVPFKRKQHPLSGFTTVTLTEETWGDIEDGRTVFVARLEGPGGKVECGHFSNCGKARWIAGEVAAFLGCNVLDATQREQGE